MADQDAQDRNLPATAKKIRQAREEGQVPRSRDLGHLMALGMGALGMMVAAPWLAARLRDSLIQKLRFDASVLASPASMGERLASASWEVLQVVLPIGLLMVLVAVAGSLVVGGWNWTLKPIAPKLGKLNPLSGVKRLFSKQQFVDALKACALALLLGTVGLAYLGLRLEDFRAAIAQPLPAAFSYAGELILGGLALLLLVLAVAAAIDAPLQRHLLASRLKMSVKEVKEEHKQSEGSPEVKGRIRARMREMASRRMLSAVPKADLVVMNPTHYAVALKYDAASMGAPRVVAKGADLLALRIRDLARGARVPVLQAPVLARALYAHADIDREIPVALFGAVAQVLAHVYQLRATAGGAAAAPVLPELDVPRELDPHASRPPLPQEGAR
ncbi:flagellar biosynthesis protein FlhB [Caldimonas tepidiphila]|uniref:flagellar biosynthesis protein FlhB n=1 Tax=Caldimonas tepidiphila TaxID=2315841 RepID=UPI000E5B1E9A|nr:flagellar biosynthesis protein FlhB [Caldimonas tepidiphila]